MKLPDWISRLFWTVDVDRPVTPFDRYIDPALIRAPESSANELARVRDGATRRRDRAIEQFGSLPEFELVVRTGEGDTPGLQYLRSGDNIAGCIIFDEGYYVITLATSLSNTTYQCEVRRLST